MIYLDSIDHSYHLKTDPSVTFTSVSKLIREYHPPFDRDVVAAKIAEKQGITPEELLQSWQDKQTQGTQIHLIIEKYFESNLRLEKYENLYNQLDKIIENSTEKISEKILYSETYKVAGTCDLIIFYEDRINIVDFKTSDTISSYAMDKMHFPIQHLYNSKLIRYSLQLNFYKYFLREMFGDPKIKIEMNLIKIPENFNLEVIPIADYQKDALNILKCYGKVDFSNSKR